MICLPLQDYITIRSDSGVSSVTQNESGWLDLAGYQDVVAFLEVKELSGATTITIAYQTSPSKDDSLFVNMAAAVTLAAGLTTTSILKATATVPVARWVRWQLGASGISGAWDAYFRVWLACNRAGKRGRVALAPGTLLRLLPSQPSLPIQRAGSASRPVPSPYGLPATFAAPAGAVAGASGTGSPPSPFGQP